MSAYHPHPDCWKRKERGGSREEQRCARKIDEEWERKKKQKQWHSQLCSCQQGNLGSLQTAGSRRGSGKKRMESRIMPWLQKRQLGCEPRSPNAKKSPANGPRRSPIRLSLSLSLKLLLIVKITPHYPTHACCHTPENHSFYDSQYGIFIITGKFRNQYI